MFPKNKEAKPWSWIDPAALDDLARALGYPRNAAFNRVLDVLRGGAKIGVPAESCKFWEGSNYPSSYLHRHLLLDTLAEWIQEGVISGSWERSEVETLIPVGRIHPMSIQLKRSGAGRIIIDMPAPRGRRVRSINAMIKDGMEGFPISMCDAEERDKTYFGQF